MADALERPRLTVLTRLPGEPVADTPVASRLVTSTKLPGAPVADAPETLRLVVSVKSPGAPVADVADSASVTVQPTVPMEPDAATSVREFPCPPQVLLLQAPWPHVVATSIVEDYQAMFRSAVPAALVGMVSVNVPAVIVCEPNV